MKKQNDLGKDIISDEVFLGASILLGALFVLGLLYLAIKKSPEMVPLFLSGLGLSVLLKSVLIDKAVELKKGALMYAGLTLVVWALFFILKKSLFQDLSFDPGFDLDPIEAHFDQKTPYLGTKTGWFLAIFVGFLVHIGVFFWGFFKENGFDEGLSSLGSSLLDFKREGKKEGVTIGKAEKGNRNFVLTESNLVHHTQVIGGSGFGKTNLLKVILEDRIRKGKAVLFLDFKAEHDMTSWLLGCAKEAGREKDFKLFSINDPKISSSYNPFKNGHATEVVSKIMACFEWSQEFYKNYSQTALIYVCEYLESLREKTGEELTLKGISDLLIDEKHFLDLEEEHGIFKKNESQKRRFKNHIFSESGQSNLVGLSSKLQNIQRSRLGENLKTAEKDQIEIEKCIKEKNILYFQMNSMKDVQSSEILGKLFLQDVISTVGEVFSKPNSSGSLKCLLMIDEFAAFATPEFVDLLNRCRGVGMGIMIAHQSVGDLKKVSEHFLSQVQANTANKIIFGTKSSEEAEFYSGMTGTKSDFKRTKVIEKDFGFEREGKRGSIREAESFKIHPNEYKNLQRGQVICIKSIVDTDEKKVQIQRANEFEFKQSFEEFFKKSEPALAQKSIQKIPSLEAIRREVSKNKSYNID